MPSTERKALLRQAFFFTLKFCLVLMAYYQVKPASRTLYNTFIGPENLPYVWIVSTLVVILLLPFLRWRANNFSQGSVVNASYASFVVLLLVFRYLLATPTQWSVFAFYILVDAYSVILIENLWSLVNSVFRNAEGKLLYGLMASGALAGGAIGGLLASVLLNSTSLKTVDLLLISAFFCCILIAVTKWMGTRGMLQELVDEKSTAEQTFHYKTLKDNPERWYILLVALLLLMSQLVQPIVEYQFQNVIGQTIPELKAQTTYLSWFFSILNGVALLLNLVVTPLVHRYFGLMAGLLVQPLAVLTSSIWFAINPVLWTAGVVKISDRASSYSINRASKELLYSPFSTETIYLVKATLDMVGYRLFKMLGSLLIIVLTQSILVTAPGLTWPVVAICLGWIELIRRLRPRYRDLSISLA